MQTQDWVRLVTIVMRVSLIMQVFAIGLETKWSDATYLFRRPSLLGKVILSRNVILPIITVLLIKTFSLHPAVAIALAVLAVTPVPPLLPRAQIRAGGRMEYVIGILVSQTVLAVALVPATIWFMDLVLGSQTNFGPGQVAAMMIKLILIPLAAGMFTAYFFPKMRQFGPVLVTEGSVLLIAGTIPLLVLTWNMFGTLSGNGTILALTIFVTSGMAVGHLLGGEVDQDRTTLALATSSRHPGMALAIARANFPDHVMLVAGTVVIYLLVRIILSIPYMRFRRTVQA